MAEQENKTHGNYQRMQNKSIKGKPVNMVNILNGYKAMTEQKEKDELR